MIPIIVLIGRTNVGKSTLFNILTKTRNALVANYPGITRDRQYGYCEFESNQKSILIDTAGLDIKRNEIEEKAHQQTLIAIKEADLILFIVDAHKGLMPQEFEISKKIRTYQKKTILIINKIDGIQDIYKFNEFYSLGFKKIKKVSASHNRGINTLINEYLTPWIALEIKNKNTKKTNYNNQESKKKPIKVAIIGRKNVRKSTLINSLLKEKKIIICNILGTTLDSIATSV
ncbi:GTPase [Buchnera aphidicola]|uniref:GTPase n=1 Tax=Buchnera aphidicola TaxID=9 RepID=UPI0021CA4F77|nr:GTPase [Buchnera aphidicola]